MKRTRPYSRSVLLLDKEQHDRKAQTRFLFWCVIFVLPAGQLHTASRKKLCQRERRCTIPPWLLVASQYKNSMGRRLPCVSTMFRLPPGQLQITWLYEICIVSSRFPPSLKRHFSGGNSKSVTVFMTVFFLPAANY